MSRYRATIRYGPAASRYEVIDVEADDLAGALRAAADAVPDEIAGSADLAEVRRQQDPERREYVPE